MARNAWPTVFTGDSWSAAQHNTYGRDNDAAYWVYTTAGDIAVASSSSSLKRLGLGSARRGLRVNAAGDDLEYQWPHLPYCRVGNAGALTNYVTPAEKIVTWDTDLHDDYGWHSTSSDTHKIIPTFPGMYRATVFISVDGVGGSGDGYWTLRWYTPDGIYSDRKLINHDANARFFSVSFPEVFCNGSSGEMALTLQHQESGNRTLNAASRLSVVRIGD